MRKRKPTLTLKQVRDNIAGLTALYRPATMAERVIDDFKAGASIEQIKRKGRYVGIDVDTIIRAYVTPGGEGPCSP